MSSMNGRQKVMKVVADALCFFKLLVSCIGGHVGADVALCSFKLQRGEFWDTLSGRVSLEVSPSPLLTCSSDFQPTIVAHSSTMRRSATKSASAALNAAARRRLESMLLNNRANVSSSASQAYMYACDVHPPSSSSSSMPLVARHYSSASCPSSSQHHACGDSIDPSLLSTQIPRPLIDTALQHPTTSSIRTYSSATSVLSQEVKITQTSASSSSPTSSDATRTNDANDQDDDDDNPFAQKAEERILEMQSHIRTHYRHAAYSEALETSHQLLDACQKLFGDSHPATASAYNNIGLMHKALGQFDDSRTNYTRALELYGDIVGTDHASYAAALNNLGNLDRAQAHVDEDLDVAQRLELNESAVKYFDDALAIRVLELGDDHPNTVTSRSNLGGALAALVLLRHAAAAEKAKAKTETGNGEEKSLSDGDSSSGGGGDKVDDRGWEAAEDHLRSALNTATANPRGRRANVSAHNQAIDARKAEKQKNKPVSKRKKNREKKMLSKHIEQQKAAATGGGSGSEIQTLSAASAAQNLAVFLKSRADVIGTAAEAGVTIPAHLDRNDMYAESRRLYESALKVRSELRDKHHPEVVATKFSLAELLAVTGDEDGANVLRSEILEAYDVTEKDAEAVEGDDTKDQ